MRSMSKREPGDNAGGAMLGGGWRQASTTVSLPEVHGSVPIPMGGGFWRKMLAFAGPGYLVAVGYMDPGNWATDLAGGSKYGYTLLSVIMLSNLMAILLQALALRLGIASGRDLAQACRDHYSRPTTIVLWLLCELAIAACDLAEVIGSAIALNLLFHLPLMWGVCLTSLDVLLVLYLQQFRFRYVEVLVVLLIVGIAGCFGVQLWLAKPDLLGVLGGFVPQAEIARNPDMLYIAVGILGATVMPHNLYLHSSIIQTRRYRDTAESKREAVRYANIDSTVALMFALFLNGAILVVAASTFHTTGNQSVAEIQDAYKLLAPLLGHATGEHLVRRRAALLRSERDAHRYPGRSDRHGRLSEHPAPTMAAAADHAPHRDCAGAHRPLLLRRGRHGPADHPQPGGAQPAAAVCRVPARAVHGRSTQNGCARRAAMDAGAGLAGRDADCRPQRLAPVADIRRLAGTTVKPSRAS